MQFLSNIWDFVVSLVEGIGTLARSLMATQELLNSTALWMPSFLFTFMVSALALIIMLRIIDR